MRSLFATFVSVGLHVGLGMTAFVYFPKTFETLEAARVVPIELVTLAERTSVRAASREPERDPEPEPVERPALPPNQLYRRDFDALSQQARHTFFREGGRVIS